MKIQVAFMKILSYLAKMLSPDGWTRTTICLNETLMVIQEPTKRKKMKQGSEQVRAHPVNSITHKAQTYKLEPNVNDK